MSLTSSSLRPAVTGSSPRLLHSQRGIALVITLILLSVTLVMAVAFLAISRRERGSVTTATDAATARLAADSALANAEAQILANVLSTTNPYNYGLIVSTNYINPFGFVPNSAYPTNVNYDYRSTGGPLLANDLLQNLANLLYLPRPPVFVVTNQNTGRSEFRFYLDLNRDGFFEDTRRDAPNVDNLGKTNGFAPQIGDPQWIGVLERPDVPHGPQNKFLSRYAFIALPAGNTLDLNAIHNQSLNTRTTWSPNDSYFRNQGVGTWEINLAAFLADLNTNEWDTVASPYQYLQPGGFANAGRAFQDAYSLLYYRYNARQMPFISTLFTNAAAALNNGPVDVFPLGPLMTNTVTPFYFYGGMNFPWPGADNTNHFFSLSSDLFNPAETALNVLPAQIAAGNYFTGRLLDAGTNNRGSAAVSSYDRYTFYRLLSQLGTDSAPESGKMNLNYDNLDVAGNVIPGAETNLIVWTPLRFFTNAVDRMLKVYSTNWFQAGPSNYFATYYGVITNYNDPTGYGLTNFPYYGVTNSIPAFGLTNIPVLMNGRFVYSPAVQRVLQLAANIYDATTNNTLALGKDYPSVFRPLFSKDAVGDVFVSSYAYVPSLTIPGVILSPPIDIGAFAASPGVLANVPDNIYGVPWIIGAKKNLPNFNRFDMVNEVQVTRKLQVSRPNKSSRPNATNQWYEFSITNSISFALWNSYNSNYNGALNIYVRDNMRMVLTNGASYINNQFTNFQFATNFTVWPGSAWNKPPPYGTPVPASFITTNWSFTFLPDSVYHFAAPAGFIPIAQIPGPQWETNIITCPPLPNFGLMTTNWLQAVILDGNHVIDYVQFNGPQGMRNLNNELADPNTTGVPAYLWSTNGVNGGFTPQGVADQIAISRGMVTVTPPGSWKAPPNMPGNLPQLPAAEAAFFSGLFTPDNSYIYNSVKYTNREVAVQAPFTPTRTIYEYTSWQANDPLVHYLASDLDYIDPGTMGLQKSDFIPAALPVITTNSINLRYMPWGGNPNVIPNPNAPSQNDRNVYNYALKDPLVYRPDDWAFPSNKFPGVGWIGRVHRGTPWQTVYLKASAIANADLGYWVTNWTGNGNQFDALNAAPLQDRVLFNIFTTALNDNATRGQLSVNQSAVFTNDPAAGLAAWSAVFSGIAVPTNLIGNYAVISPVGSNGTNSPLWQIVTNINWTRTQFTNTISTGGAFKQVGDILASPALTEQSPFLAGRNFTNSVSDALMEWLPQQTMSLLRASDTPRFVVYSYGQTLTPAPNAVVTSGGSGFFGMITNYSVVSEIVTRAVVRVEGAPTNAHAVIESFNVLPPD